MPKANLKYYMRELISQRSLLVTDSDSQGESDSCLQLVLHLRVSLCTARQRTQGRSQGESWKTAVVCDGGGGAPFSLIAALVISASMETVFQPCMGCLDLHGRQDINVINKCFSIFPSSISFYFFCKDFGMAFEMIIGSFSDMN